MSAPTYRLVGGPYDGRDVETYRDLPLLRVLTRFNGRLCVGAYLATDEPRVLRYVEGGAP